MNKILKLVKKVGKRRRKNVRCIAFLTWNSRGKKLEQLNAIVENAEQGLREEIACIFLQESGAVDHSDLGAHSALRNFGSSYRWSPSNVFEQLPEKIKELFKFPSTQQSMVCMIRPELFGPVSVAPPFATQAYGDTENSYPAVGYKLRNVNTNEIIAVANIHLNPQSSRQAKLQLGMQLLESVAGFPFFIAGDFNLEPNDVAEYTKNGWFAVCKPDGDTFNNKRTAAKVFDYGIYNQKFLAAFGGDKIDAYTDSHWDYSISDHCPVAFKIYK